MSSFSVDEPVGAAIDAARGLPGVDFLVTGDPARCPCELREALPANVRLVGFLDRERYREALAASDAVLALTTEPTSVMRAAYEAVYAHRPLVLSDFPTSRALFPYAVHAANDPEELATAVAQVRRDLPHYVELAQRARTEQLKRWQSQRGALLDVVDSLLDVHRPTDAGPGGPILLDRLTEPEAVRRVVAAARTGRGGRVTSVNVDILRQAVKDPALAELVNAADLVLADGMPIVWAVRLQGTALAGRVPGSEMIWALCDESARAGVSVLLVGGSPGTAERAAGRLAESTPGLRIDHLCPPLGFDRSDEGMRKVITAIEDANPGIVFCGLGAPKQERVMAALTRLFPSTWFVACGGTFSMVCGDLPRAPRWMRACSLEWCHRLWLEPRRLFRRYVINDLPFSLRLFATSALLRLGLRAPALLHVNGGDPLRD